jgi:hypothetical protein
MSNSTQSLASAAIAFLAATGQASASSIGCGPENENKAMIDELHAAYHVDRDVVEKGVVKLEMLSKKGDPRQTAVLARWPDGTVCIVQP